MRPTLKLPRNTARAALGLALAAGLLSLSVPARAGDDDVPLDTQLFRSLMKGLGLKRGDEPQINYQERPPLVIPPSRDLPPPEKVGAPIANNAAWPNDPDIARAKAEAEKEKNRNIFQEIETEQNPLRPDQMTPGAKPGAAKRRTKSAAANSSVSANGTDRLEPNELGYKGGMWGNLFGSRDDNETVKFTGEPTRSALTDPPPGYLTPSPGQPYGLTTEKARPKAVDSYATHGEISSDSR